MLLSFGSELKYLVLFVDYDLEWLLKRANFFLVSYIIFVTEKMCARNFHRGSTLNYKVLIQLLLASVSFGKVGVNFRTSYVQEKVNIGSGPPGSKVRWFRSKSDEPRFINTVTFDAKDDSPTLVMVHGYGASQGFFFRNFDALTSRFRVIAIDQLG